ncbi:hypothetical protein GCM10012275_48610 [Longimycelium tulufanense]|uniref:PPIase cyclophilin-type domain-containing protein n=1 Tax=Longimycelium tulufanense TaxID=907463 RepID=A0A8J3CGH5_9PSEU|nr:peptidylprolyl isomerase [Longimycelium tulufanense]GGM72346.1 hypothetical protein GCM10012275_48610 [Longimycelium tulufanense]
MPTNEQRRQAAKRKLERQLKRRAERAKRRRILGAVSAVVATALVGTGIYYLATRESTSDAAADASTSPTTPAKTSGGPCEYTEAPGEKPAKNVGMPDDPNPTPDQGKVQVTLKTSQGDIPLTLDRAKAPCTVQSFVHLAKKKFFDDTSCHRMTTTDGLKVLQCGDPTGTGQGGPGYTIKDEVSPDLKYTRGTLAMAKTQAPNSGGSQFFMVYGDSQLPPNYTVFGSIGEDGLKALDKVAAGGVEAGPRGEGDGKPKIPVEIKQAVVAN